MNKCNLCGCRLRTGVVNHTVAFGNERVDVQVAARICDACDESFTDALDLEDAERGVAAKIIKTGRSSGPRLRFLRHVLELNAKTLAGMLGVTPETVSRWETGARDVDPYAWLAVSMLVLDRIAGRANTSEVLEAMRSPRNLEPEPTRKAS